MDEAATQGFHAAIEAIEGASSVEVVVAVRPRARRDLVAHITGAAVLLIGALAYVLFSEAEFAALLPHRKDQVNELPDDVAMIHPRGIRRRRAS